MQLTKTDFIQYLNCPSSLWLLKNNPETFLEYKGEFSLFLEKLVREGYEVEEYVLKMFPDCTDLKNVLPSNTLEFIQHSGYYEQVALKTESGLYARLDIIEVHEDKSITIYEVKSSTSIKKDKTHNHLKDIAFQKYVAEQSGLVVRDVVHVHLDKEFRKNGEIDVHDLVIKQNVNEEVEEISEQTILEIEEALQFIQKETIREDQCDCLMKTRANHCDTFTYFNKNIPEYSIYELNRLSQKKIQLLQDMGITAIKDIPADFELSSFQELQREVVEDEQGIRDDESIKATLSKLEYPLYFFDYETLPFAIPRVEGFGPHQHLPVQYSLHTVHENGEVVHTEYLASELAPPIKLIEQMKQEIGKTGTLVSWYASFEQTRNREMAKMYPEHADFLDDINVRTFDLMDIFKKDFVHRDFHGSQSIKKVQPVLVPELSYKTLDVQSGTMAVDAAERLFEMTDETEIKELRDQMLEYCKLDTLAMVKIWEELK